MPTITIATNICITWGRESNSTIRRNKTRKITCTDNYKKIFTPRL